MGLGFWVKQRAGRRGFGGSGAKWGTGGKGVNEG